MVREVSWNMPGDQLRTFVERNQKKEMDGNRQSSLSQSLDVANRCILACKEGNVIACY